ncbi:glycosyltransferase family 2 protein [Mycolicibacterium sp.]|uniref:glycosyltransferase family 2 protein n=1 Tax=Mycolicibacterium sp. TaxID=2320850 RepID=UPI001A1C39F6|nr:glycosyltransferase family 2 protein [Mycolicibacterium sp.]MBJ7338776.1 glycosyltransferase family 2 protein [Mycolicibacterium sp.]
MDRDQDGVVGQTMPVVSVCIPMYNNASTVTRCLDTVLAQEGVDFEVLVVDDDSTDDSATIVAAALRPSDRLIRNRTRLGLVGNHNKCLQLALGTYIQFVHADDWLLPGALRTLATEMDESHAAMAFAPRQIVTDDTDFLRRYGQLHTHFRNLHSRNDGLALVKQMTFHGVHHNWIGEPTCVMFQRQLALDAGSFRDDIYQLLDLDLWLRLMLRGPVSFLPRELSARCHTTATESVRNKAIRRDWLDQMRVIASMVVDTAAPPRVRLLSLMWWFLIWPRVGLEGVAFGPQRYEHLKVSAAAPFTEFARARRVLCAEHDVAAVPTPS